LSANGSPGLVQQMQSGSCHLTYGLVVVPVGYGQVRAATQLPVLTMVCGHSQCDVSGADPALLKTCMPVGGNIFRR
jgi:hypothetical protein